MGWLFHLAVANGFLNGAMEHRFPVVLGKDFARTVDAVGAGVEGCAVGDRVFGMVTKDYLGDGSFAEYVTAPASVGVTRLPDSIEFTEAAGLGLAGTAAVDAFDAAGITAGSTALVSGATGGVGQQAVQLAARAGATVIATAHTDEEREIVQRLEATEVVDHTDDVVAQVLRLHPEGVDAVLHFAGPAEPLAAAVRPRGGLISTVAQSLEAEQVRFAFIYAHPSSATLDRLASNQAEQRTQVTVQRVYDLERTTDAFAHFAGAPSASW